MLFNKYQYRESAIQKRGYSQTCIAQDETDSSFWVKWILGIDKDSIKSKILADKLRHLQKVRHSTLPELLEFGFDEEQQTYAIVFKEISHAKSLEQQVAEINEQAFVRGVIDVIDCLKELHLKHRINHGDLHPGNILIDGDGQFYLIDFGLSDITQTLSQQKDLEIFARAFTAPEKLQKTGNKGFPYQSDIYSVGKIIEWFYAEKQIEISEEQSLALQSVLHDEPAQRPGWDRLLEILSGFMRNKGSQEVGISFRNRYHEQLIEKLNTYAPVFDVSPQAGANILMNLLVADYLCEGVLWIKNEQKLLINTIVPLAECDEKRVRYIAKEGKKLKESYRFSIAFSSDRVNLTTYFEKWQLEKQSKNRWKEAGKKELDFYEELLKKEKDVIARNSLRLQYSNYRINRNDIEFDIRIHDNADNEGSNLSSIGFVWKHIDEGNSILSEGFEYMLSATGDKKQNKNAVVFSGKPFSFDNNKLRIKDFEHLNKDAIPRSGYLFENTAKKEEEKNRQLDAIRKVNKNEVQNPDLIYYLFKPLELNGRFIDYETEELNVFQKDGSGQALSYSYHQRKAIINALQRKPVTVIQGPPGTGKTTVITEIVFQLLKQQPEAKILITSQTNNAVDQVLENLINNAIPVLRLSGVTKPRNPLIQKHTVEAKLSGWKEQVMKSAKSQFRKEQQKLMASLNDSIKESIVSILLEEAEWKPAKQKIENIASRIQSLEAIRQLPNEQQRAIELLEKTLNIQLCAFMELAALHKDWISTITGLDEKSALNQKLIDSIRVIGATCNHIASKSYSKFNFEFDYVIMDESGKATLAEALVPIVLGNNLVFVGDHRQLRPMLTTTREVESWLREKYKKEADELENQDDYFNRPSLFENVINAIDLRFKTQLTECRRSSKEQVKLTSECFYEPEGDDEIVPIDRGVEKEHNLPLAIPSSVFFIDIGADYKSEMDDKSAKNTRSAELIPRVLEELNKYEAVKNYSIGVITGYSAQQKLLKRSIEKLHIKKPLTNITQWDKREEKLTVSVVDRFQGLERDIVIVDLVKSGPGLKLGFLEVPNRINVALSRQKRLLIIVGDYHSLVNATTSDRLKQNKAALQLYLEKIKPAWRIKSTDIKQLFV
ncbi:MAG: hypothetical protein RIS29_709 [Bacteroidota bacterium]|jgi:superfamily I DNA and/or RNA helicase/tRNA A-37 threonylcarbamoyl transferase component Bud32